MSKVNEWVVAFIICVLVLLLLACFGSRYWETEEQRSGVLDFMLASAESQPELCVADEASRERIRAIMVDALDDALKDQIMHLFEIWMKDDRGQPDRAKVGVRAAIKAHQGARKAALEWMPQICSQ